MMSLRPKTNRLVSPVVNCIVPSPATNEAFAVGRVMVTDPVFPSEHLTGKTTVALCQLAKVPEQVLFESETENFPSEKVVLKVV